ncbi:MAG: UvrD-helicase domain-containing protein [Candidatus Paceibacterota bacterium]|jgi:superfamily I DNA/RNA helicase
MDNGSNKLIIAAAGSGKTTFIINEALKKKEGKILITTYTLANEEEIRRKFIKINKCIPENVTIKTWFSFLLQHGARPYQGCKFKKDISGLILVNKQSAIGIAESDTQKHYFTENQRIFSDKLSKFVVKCNEGSKGAVISRLSRIYTDIFIDEIQDLAGYDLDFLNLIIQSTINVLLVGDPRQSTYSTNNSSKNKKFKKSKIVNFFEGNLTKSSKIEIDDSSLMINYRSCPAICDLSNKLFPGFKKTTSGNEQITNHDGVFLIKKIDIKRYLQKYHPIQLRWDSRTEVEKDYKVLNFGISKGLEFERVIIYPTTQFIGWLKDDNFNLNPVSRSKLYVAITRAMYSVGIVCDENLKIDTINSISFSEIIE